METIARSQNLYGPYEPNPANPILTNANTTEYCKNAFGQYLVIMLTLMHSPNHWSCGPLPRYLWEVVVCCIVNERWSSVQSLPNGPRDSPYERNLG